MINKPSLNILPVILSGGAGTRLWPVSREGHPKPFMKLADGQSLLEKTYLRAKSLPNCVSHEGVGQLLTVTNRDYYFMSRDVLSMANACGSFLLEPFGKNTAPAIAFAAHKALAAHGQEVILLVLAADHLIGDQSPFEAAVAKAVRLANQDYLVTFGITPSTPDTGFGYIECGASLGEAKKVSRFVEKPDLTTAQSYIDSGRYLWNSGMFCFKATTFLDELHKHAPEVDQCVSQCWKAMSFQDGLANRMWEIPAQLFTNCPDISVDYAVMEPSEKVAVIESDFGWNDIGSWNAVRDLVAPDAANNRAVGDAIFVNSSNTFIQSEDRLVAAVGLSNLMIIDTPDALLVANPDHAQDVKVVVSKLKELGHEAAKLHRTVVRPWGTYTVLQDHPGFKIKRIEVNPGARLSLQMHQYRSEHWIVVSGEAIVVNGDQTLTIRANQSTYIPAGHQHRLENKTNDELILIEVQCGPYLGEDDIVRFEDNYGRV